MADKSGRGRPPRHTPSAVNLYPYLLHEQARPIARVKLQGCSARITGMTDNTGGTISVGSRVTVTVPDPDGSTTYAGVVIEDYADMVIDSGSVGRDWAPVHRWAIALDDGRLIFANDEDLATAD